MVKVSSEIMVCVDVELFTKVMEDPIATVNIDGEKVLSNIEIYFVGRVPPMGLKLEFCLVLAAITKQNIRAGNKNERPLNFMYWLISVSNLLKNG